VYDALTSDRPYRRAFPVDNALGEIHRQVGQHFDPELVQIFMHVITQSESLINSNGRKVSNKQRAVDDI
jgi:putative two-component system response regulator